MTISRSPSLAGYVGGRAHAQPPGDLPRVAGAAPALLGAVGDLLLLAREQRVARERVERRPAGSSP